MDAYYHQTFSEAIGGQTNIRFPTLAFQMRMRVAMLKDRLASNIAIKIWRPNELFRMATGKESLRRLTAVGTI